MTAYKYHYLIGRLLSLIIIGLPMQQTLAQAPNPAMDKPSASALLNVPKPKLASTQFRPTRGQIALDELKETVKTGVPALLAQVRLKPVMRKGRFVGFKLAYIQKGSVVEQAGFQVNDIIMAVNQEPIGRPEQMMHTLSILPYAPHILVSFERQGISKEWIWLIRR